MNRREWLQTAMLGAAGLAVDPERFGWRRTKTFFIPPPTPIISVIIDEYSDFISPSACIYYADAEHNLWFSDGKTQQRIPQISEWELRQQLAIVRNA